MSIEKSIHPYKPYVPDYATRMIIGTIPPERFCLKEKSLGPKDVDFYYGSNDNYFWELAGFNKSVNGNSIAARKKFLREREIGIADIISTCYRKNNGSFEGSSQDKDLFGIECYDLIKLLRKHPRIHTLIYTSGSTGVKKIMGGYLNTTHRPIDKETREYSVEIDGNCYTVILLYSPSPTAQRGLKNPEDRIKQYSKIFGTIG